MNHLVERRRDQAAETDDRHVLPFCRFQYLIRGHHHPQIDDIVAIATQYDADDIFSDIMYVALYRGQQYFGGPGSFLVDGAGGDVRQTAFFFFRFNIRREHRYGFFHDTGALYHLGKEHLATAEKVTYHIHTGHEGTFDHFQGFVFGFKDGEVREFGGHLRLLSQAG